MIYFITTMTLLFNKKLQKSQLHGDWVKLANYRGTFTNPGSIPGSALAYDTWMYTGLPTSFAGLKLRRGDIVQKLVDANHELNSTNVTALRWRVERTLTSEQIDWLVDAASGNLKADRIQPLSGSTIDLHGFTVRHQLIDLGEF